MKICETTSPNLKVFINDKAIIELKEAFINHECYDSWGDVEFGNDMVSVDYNICIDNTTEETENCSAFYRLIRDQNGIWQHDECQEFFAYNIDFSDKNWENKLKQAAKDAFKFLFPNHSRNLIS